MLLLSIGINWLDNLLQFMEVILIFIFVLAVTYFVTRWIAKYQKISTVNNNLKIIETCRIANNKYLQIVKAGEKYLVIAVSKDSVTMLTEIDKEQIKELPLAFEGSKGESFDEILGKIKEKAKSFKYKK